MKCEVSSYAIIYTYKEQVKESRRNTYKEKKIPSSVQTLITFKTTITQIRQVTFGIFLLYTSQKDLLTAHDKHPLYIHFHLAI